MELLLYILVLAAGVFVHYLIDRFTSFLEPVLLPAFRLVFLCLFVLLMVGIVVLIVL